MYLLFLRLHKDNLDPEIYIKYIQKYCWFFSILPWTLDGYESGGDVPRSSRIRIDYSNMTMNHYYSVPFNNYIGHYHFLDFFYDRIPKDAVISEYLLNWFDIIYERDSTKWDFPEYKQMYCLDLDQTRKHTLEELKRLEKDFKEVSTYWM
jgi:hypothetical protein